MDEFKVEGTNHPMVTASSWDIPESDRQVSGKARMLYTLPHIRPSSVLIAPMGNLWEPDAWWHLQDMLLTTAMAGHSVSLQEMRDSSLFPSEAIHMMRWSASMMARDSGVEWLLMVDNDCLVEKDTLIKLMAHDRPVIYPFVEDLEKRFPEAIAPLSSPRIEFGNGLVPVRWSVMSCMLFNTKIFNVLDSVCWRGSDYAFAQALNFIGHRIYVDTDTVVKVVKGPARHASKPYDEFWDGHKTMYNRLQNEDRNREPPPNFDPLKDDGFVDKYGTYFGVPNESE